MIQNQTKQNIVLKQLYRDNLLNESKLNKTKQKI